MAFRDDARLLLRLAILKHDAVEWKCARLKASYLLAVEKSNYQLLRELAKLSSKASSMESIMPVNARRVMLVIDGHDNFTVCRVAADYRAL